MIAIGKYHLERSKEGKIWISIINDGEGGDFDEKKLEAVIDAFYNENF